MTLQGADLAHKKKAEKIDSPIFRKFGNAAEIMKKIKAAGGTFGCCPPCAEYFGASVTTYRTSSILPGPTGL